jgi:hypothetical protein
MIGTVVEELWSRDFARGATVEDHGPLQGLHAGPAVDPRRSLRGSLRGYTRIATEPNYRHHPPASSHKRVSIAGEFQRKDAPDHGEYCTNRSMYR